MTAARTPMRHRPSGALRAGFSGTAASILLFAAIAVVFIDHLFIAQRR
jgi:hypothetical protein